MPVTPPFGEQAHKRREVAESFGADAERYDRARPRYPAALVERIVAASPGPDVLDVGCGTGIVAEQLRAAGCRVLGVDVDARMAAVARRRGFEVEVARFESWDAKGRTFDAVVAGQTWHWVDAVAGAVKAAGVLRPGGRLALFWNVFQPPPEIGSGFAAVYRRVAPDLPTNLWAASALDGYLALVSTAADGIEKTGAFGDPRLWRFDWEQPYTRDEWLDQVPTHGGHSGLPPERLDAVLAGVGAVVDAAGGRFTMGYATVSVTATRSAA